jgi:alpha-tubulin suppressor-like RCC1 family protein
MAAQEIHLGGAHSLFLDHSGAIWEWGNGNSLPTTVAEFASYKVHSISSQGHFNGAILEEGELVVWESGESPSPSTPAAQNLHSLSIGGTQSLSLDHSGVVHRWMNHNPTQTTQAVSELPAAIEQIRSSKAHFLALDSTGAVWSWGENSCGELGRPNTTEVNNQTPSTIPSLPPITSIFTNNDSTSLAIDIDGGVWGWGKSDYGELGISNRTESVIESECVAIPRLITDLPPIKKLSVGLHHVLALDLDHSIWAWGSNFFYQLGYSAEQSVQPQPQLLTTVDNIIALSAGNGHSAAEDEDGNIWAWGGNWDGQLGLGLTEQATYPPQQIRGYWGMTDIRGTPQHKLFVFKDGQVFARGSNRTGLFGISPEVTPHSETPITIPSLSNIMRVDTSSYHSLALDTNGSVWSWGDNQLGQLGQGDREPRIEPHPIHLLSTPIQKISVGDYHSLALDEAGQVWGWGSNQYGQLGKNPTSLPFSETPIAIEGLPETISINAGRNHNIALDKQGQAWIWGGEESTPTQISDTGTLSLIAASGNHSYLYTTDGKLIQWGTDPQTHKEDQHIQQLSLPSSLNLMSNLTSIQNGNPLLDASGILGDEYSSSLDAIEALGMDFIGGIWSGDRNFGNLIGAERSLFLPESNRHQVTRRYQLQRGWNLINLNFTEDTPIAQTLSQSEISFLISSSSNDITTDNPNLHLHQTSLDELSALSSSMGFWVNSPSEQTFQISGIADSIDFSQLTLGWNLVTIPDGLSLREIASHINQQTPFRPLRSYLYSSEWGWLADDPQRDLPLNQSHENNLDYSSAAAWILITEP